MNDRPEPTGKAASPDDQPPGQANGRPAELAALDRIRARGAKRRQAKPRAAEWSSARDPQPLADAVDELIEVQGWGGEVSVAELVVRWAQIVGPANAEHCQVTGFDNGLLTIEADSSAWATQIGWLVETIQSRIDQEIGQNLVTGIRVRGPAGPPRAKGRWRVKPPP
ncbi:MAG: DciA family protein [Micrococcales bacterium]|nr:DciA family protein [Micrococcales bacterium]